MARGRGRSSAKRGRPRTVPLPVQPQEDGPPPAKRRRSGRPSKLSLAQEREKLRQEEAEIEEQLERMQQQVLGGSESSSSSSSRPPGKRSVGRPRKNAPVTPAVVESPAEEEEEGEEEGDSQAVQMPIMEEEQSCGLHMTTMQIKALSNLVACKDCGESITLSVRPTTKGMISEFVVGCTVCEAKKVTITPNLVRERKRKKEVKGLVLQKTENINYAHVAAFLDNGLGYSGLRHYCKYFNARCLNEATFIVYARQVIQDVVNDTEDNLQSNARIVRKVYDAGLDEILDITVSFTTTYHQWGSDFCLVAGAVIELQTGLVLDYDVANMYCHVCKINAKRIISMTPTEMTDWFNKHQSSCEIREWCDELDHDAEEGVKDIEPKYLECFVAKKIWSRSMEKFGFRYSTLIHESDETIHNELLRSAPYGDTLVMIDNLTNCFSRRKSEHARTAFQNKLKSKCPRERVQTKDRIMYVYAMSIPEYNRFAVGSNIKLRELVRRMEVEEAESEGFTLQVLDTLPTIQAHEVIPADGEAAEVIYTHDEGDQMFSIEGEAQEQDEDQPEQEEQEGEEEEEQEEEQEEEEAELEGEEEEQQQQPEKQSIAKQSKKVKTEIKRENIVIEAVDEESTEYDQQTSVSHSEGNSDSSKKSASEKVSPKPLSSVSSCVAGDSSEVSIPQTQQIIFVSQGSAAPKEADKKQQQTTVAVTKITTTTGSSSSSGETLTKQAPASATKDSITPAATKASAASTAAAVSTTNTSTTAATVGSSKSGTTSTTKPGPATNKPVTVSTTSESKPGPTSKPAASTATTSKPSPASNTKISNGSTAQDDAAEPKS